MIDYEFTRHAYNVLRERRIQESWIQAVLANPERVEHMDDGTVHYIRSIQEFGGRYLRVIVNPLYEPQKIVTLFFDRKLGART